MHVTMTNAGAVRRAMCGWVRRAAIGATACAAAALLTSSAEAAAPKPAITAAAVNANLYPGGTLYYTVTVNNPAAGTWTFQATVSAGRRSWNATFPALTAAVDAGVSTVSGQSVAIAIPATFHGNATLKITAKSGNRAVRAFSRTITVGDIAADFTATPTSGALPLTVQFTDTSICYGTKSGWLWDFGDGATSTLQNPSHEYAAYGTGSYTVSLTVTGPNGANTRTKAACIAVTPPVPVNVPAKGVSVQLSRPRNGSFYVAGERPWVLVVLNDDSGNDLTTNLLSTLSLYMYGPQEQSLSKTPRTLLAAGGSTNGLNTVNLLTSPLLLVNGNVLAYQLGAISSELPGTYSVGVRATLSADSLQQWFPVASCQIGTATAETQIVSKENCGSCHLGSISGKYYFHHIDPSSRSPVGSPAYESVPVQSCKFCHNQDGYAGFTDPRSGSRVPDAIVVRAHGVHMGGELENLSSTGYWLMTTNVSGTFVAGNVVTGDTSAATAPIVNVATNGKYLVVGVISGTFSANETIRSGAATAKFLTKRNGVFVNYTGEELEVEFPKDIRNCTACHSDNRWKTAPSRQACGTCHDNLWFGDKTKTPQGMENHPSGPAINDSDFATPADENYYCLVCHASGGLGEGIEEAHEHGPALGPDNLGCNAIDVTMTKPANNKYYVAGEKPVVSLVFRDDNGNALTNHSMVNATWFSTVSLAVYGPRSNSLPVLTRVAALGLDVASRPSVTCGTAGPWSSVSGQVWRIAVNGSAPTDITIASTTAAGIVAQLNPILTGLCVSGVAGSGAVATVSSGKVKIQSLTRGVNSKIAIYDGPVTAAMGWKGTGITMNPYVVAASQSTPVNNLIYTQASPLDAPVDPNITVTTSNVAYQLSDVAALQPGTYFVYALDVPKSNQVANFANPCGIGFIRFQVGTTNVDKNIATCKDCHGETLFHLDWAHPHPAKFDADACKACHDYSHPNVGEMFSNQGGTSQNGWSGYGAMPISRRVHGVHFGHYLEHSEEIYANATKATFGWIIFPQDVRNCTKCHSQSDTWKQKPSRLACLGCHDSDAAKAHGKLMTDIADPGDPYGASAEESCEVCHGADAAFSPDKVHSIANPYVPPYPRE